MKNPDVIIAYPNSQDKLQALTTFMNELHIPFEVATIDSPYKKEFIDRILKGDVDKINDKGRKITIEELDKLWK